MSEQIDITRAAADGVRTNYFAAPLTGMLGLTLGLQSSSQWRAAAENQVRKVKICKFVVLAAILSFAAGCAGSRRLQHVESLRQESNWPNIRAAAEIEVARRDGNTQWSHSAYYSPREHTNGVWYVVASGAYPLNRLGDSIDLLIKDRGEIVSYTPRMQSHPK
jgi:hypothetical protein